MFKNLTKKIVTLAGLSAAFAFAGTSEFNDPASTSVSTTSQSGVLLLPDKGPDKINVTDYPAQQQAGYKLFSNKCASCHSLARPINTTMTRDEWERDVKRMINKPNSGTNFTQGKQIVDFLAFDQTERKDKNPEGFATRKGKS
jgi:hypothetical protein